MLHRPARWSGIVTVRCVCARALFVVGREYISNCVCVCVVSGMHDESYLVLRGIQSPKNKAKEMNCNAIRSILCVKEYHAVESTCECLPRRVKVGSFSFSTNAVPTQSSGSASKCAQAEYQQQQLCSRTLCGGGWLHCCRRERFVGGRGWPSCVA